MTGFFSNFKKAFGDTLTEYRQLKNSKIFYKYKIPSGESLCQFFIEIRQNDLSHKNIYITQSGSEIPTRRQLDTGDLLSLRDKLSYYIEKYDDFKIKEHFGLGFSYMKIEEYYIGIKYKYKFNFKFEIRQDKEGDLFFMILSPNGDMIAANHMSSKHISEFYDELNSIIYKYFTNDQN